MKSEEEINFYRPQTLIKNEIDKKLDTLIDYNVCSLNAKECYTLIQSQLLKPIS